MPRKRDRTAPLFASGEVKPLVGAYGAPDGWSAEDCAKILADPDASEDMKAAAKKRKASIDAPVSASLRCTVLGAVSARKLRIRVVGAGFGTNFDAEGQWYVPATDDGIGSARKCLGGARVHWHKSPSGEFDHAERFGAPKALVDWIGTDHDVGYLSDLEASADGLTATLNLDEDVPADVAAALTDKRVGFSVECMAARRPAIRDGKRVAELVNFAHFPDRQASVAIVSHPALRGEVLSLAASRKPAPLAAANRSTAMTLEQARAVLASSTATEEEKAKAKLVVDQHEIDEHKKKLDASMKEIEAQLLASRKANAKRELDTALADSKLPTDSCDVIRDVFAATIEKGETPKAEDIAKQVERQRKLIAAVAPTNRIGSLEIGAGPREKLALGLERLLMGDAEEWAQKRYSNLAASHKSKLVASASSGQLLASREQAAGIGYGDRAWSFRRLFQETTGVNMEDLFRRAGRERRELTASINVAQFGDIFENVLNIAGYAYQEAPRYSNWRKIVKIVPINGTLKQERVVRFGYGNLPIVSEGGNYLAATSPGDHGHGYTPAKRGYTEDWTIESILNDRIGALRDIVQGMAFAATRTINDFVFDQLTVLGMPTMDYDSVALFHSSSHGANLNTSALTATSLAAARLVMLKQTDVTTGKRLSLRPRFLLVRDDLYQTAYDLLLAQLPPGSTSQYDFIRDFGLEIIPVTPTTNGWDTVADWVLAVDPNNGQVPGFEMGFEGGREMAEIFVQDMGNVGSLFERDVVTVAIKQPYCGGSPLRHEGFFINDV